MNRLATLTCREREVLTGLMAGLTVEQIAKREHVGVCTVRSHVRQVLWKLDVNTQLAAVAYAHHALIDEHVRHEAVERLLTAEHQRLVVV
jgi:DNA-binding NarL/FixJ family response regulator